MAKQQVYISVVKDVNDYGRKFFSFLPPSVAGTDFIVFKPIYLKKDDNPVLSVINWFNSDKFHERIKETGKEKEIYERMESIGIRFSDFYSDEDGKKHKRIILDNEAYDYLCTWRMEINTSDDNYVTLTMGDSTFPIGFCNKEVIDKYCVDEINDLIKNKMVELADEEDSE